MSDSGVTVSMNMSPKKAGAMYMKNLELKKENKELKSKISRALDCVYSESNESLDEIQDILTSK